VGLTLIRKSDDARRKRNPKVALVLAGGAVSGGAFKIGGLKALNDYLGERKITDFDIYVGLSAGSILSASLASGITPDEMLQAIDGTSPKFDQLRPIDFYSPNVKEFVSRPVKLVYDLCAFLPGIGFDFARGLPGLPEAMGPIARKFAKSPNYTNFEAMMMRLIEHVSPKRSMPAITNHIPSGFFDNVNLERWVRRSLERIRMPNDFRAFKRKTGCSLYITACDLDTAERAIFGADEISEVTISQAVQASSALPIFYKPARMNGIDYIDGGVRHTANIDIAIEKGADLIVCYNPFRPFLNRVDSPQGDTPYFSEGRYLSDPHAPALASQAGHSTLHRRRPLSGRHRAARAAGARRQLLHLEPHGVLEAQRGRPPRLRVRAQDHRAELRAALGGFREVRPRHGCRRGSPTSLSRPSHPRLAGRAGGRRGRGSPPPPGRLLACVSHRLATRTW
jgi:predicted acylesterase/phospholipase RssA